MRVDDSHDPIVSAIVMCETESGKTFQAAFTPQPGRPVEVVLETETNYEPLMVWSPRQHLYPARETYTLTVTAGQMRGQLRVPTATAVQAGANELEGDE